MNIETLRITLAITISLAGVVAIILIGSVYLEAVALIDSPSG